MPSLKEIKGHIGSVKSTLKITSAMKLVASAKLRKAQTAIENMLPYERGLRSILAEVGDRGPLAEARAASGKVALVAFASNSSLCGGFNANAIRETRARVKELSAQGKQVTVFSVGRRIADSMAKAGYPSPKDMTKLSAKPEYEGAKALAESLRTGFESGEYEGVELIYNHFVTAATQQVTREQYLPMALGTATEEAREEMDQAIVEPSKEEVLEALVPKVLNLKIYTVLLDSAAAEHAARTIAMQTATDNGDKVLQELTLEYNKGRQQKITAEILDLVGGQQES